MNILIAGKTNQTDNYQQAFKELGACPVVWLPKERSAFGEPDSLSRFNGLLLPGGGDIHPGFFCQENEGSHPADIALDCQQISLFHSFFKAGKPILGICKGMQIINVALGGTLIQDLPAPLLKAHAAGGSDQVHSTSVLADTFLHRLYGDSLITNSAHHQAVDRLGNGLLPAQYGPGQVLEGFFHVSLPVLGVQWHPERMLHPAQNRKAGETDPTVSGQKKSPVTGDGSRVLLYFLSLCQLSCT